MYLSGKSFKIYSTGDQEELTISRESKKKRFLEYTGVWAVSWKVDKIWCDK